MRVLSAITGKRSPVTSDNLRSAYSMQYYDNSKIIRETGISFIPVRKSIEDTCRIYIKEARH
jgi:dihydroflavonol-4-reductase